MGRTSTTADASDRAMKKQRTLFDFSYLVKIDQPQRSESGDSGNVTPGVRITEPNDNSSGSANSSLTTRERRSKPVPWVGNRKRARPKPVRKTVIELPNSELMVVWTRRYRELEAWDDNLISANGLDITLKDENKQLDLDTNNHHPPFADEELITEAISESSPVSQNESIRLSKEHYFLNSKSIYTKALENALESVFGEEKNLFNTEEHATFDYWVNSLSEPAKNLFAKLFTRQDRWHSLEGLEISFEMTPGSLDDYVTELLLPTFETPFINRSFEDIQTVREALELLRLEELKDLARRLNYIPFGGKMNKSRLIEALDRLAKSQSTLPEDFIPSLLPSNPTTPDSRSEAPPAITKHTTISSAILNDVHQMKGACLRLDCSVRTLFRRLLIVNYRLNEWSVDPLRTAILVKMDRVTFPAYNPSPVPSAFRSRRQVIEYEKALEKKKQIEEILDGSCTLTDSGTRMSDQDRQAFAVSFFDKHIYKLWKEEVANNSAVGEVPTFLLQFTPGWVYTKIAHQIISSLGKLKRYDREHQLLTEILSQRRHHPGRRGRWYGRKALVEERYMATLATDADSDSETEKQTAGTDQGKIWIFQALATCEQGLQDPLVTPVFHYDLQRRIERLEKTLQLPISERHSFAHVRLAEPERDSFEGTRVVYTATQLATRNSRKAAHVSAGQSGPTMWLDPEVVDNIGGDGFVDSSVHFPDGQLPVCSVEQLCLHWYSQEEGWKGMHSEGGVIRALFAILFFDILFPRTGSSNTQPEGVFQSPYQTAPLDLFSSGFLAARKGVIEARLEEICQGSACEIAERNWSEYSHSSTHVVGLRWSEWTSSLISEIVSCWPPVALSEVCRSVASDYRALAAGVPDLFMWQSTESAGSAKSTTTLIADGGTNNCRTGKIKFVEVKSETDRLQEQKQRFWIDMLSRLGVPVVVCDVYASRVVKLVI